MKKDFFKLSHKEYTKIKKKFTKTPYGKRYSLFAGIIFIVLFIILINEFYLTVAYLTKVYLDRCLVLLAIMFFYFVLVEFKWMDLIRDYYNKK